MSQSLKTRALSNVIRFGLRPFLGGRLPYKTQRAMALAATSICIAPTGMRHRALTLGGVAGEEVRVDDRAESTLLWLHGGGYCVGSSRTDRAAAGQFAKASGARVIVPDYRLAPEHPHPAALEDALAVYRALIDQGQDTNKLILGGDSAGGGLALALAVELRDKGLPLPAGMVLFSPWVDLRNVQDSHRSRAAEDPWLSTAMLNNWAAAYCGKTPTDTPSCSPLLAELHDLPPAFIQVGEREILLDDAVELDRKLQSSGVQSDLHIYPEMWHVFFLQAGLLTEADRAVTDIGRFVQRRTATAHINHE